MTVINIYVDGGCLGNGTPNAKCYGSFSVENNNKVVKRSDRLPFPDLRTNNQAEYAALIMALKYAKDLVVRDADVHALSFQFIMDSAIVVNQVNGFWKINNLDLRHLADKAKDLIANLDACMIQVDRSVIVSHLGH